MWQLVENVAMANPEHVEIVKAGADAIREWWAKYPEGQLDLSGADLSHAKISGAYLYNADLSRARLSGADLEATDLRKLDGRGADFTAANLRAAKLRGAILTDAILRGTNLGRANLAGVPFCRASFRQACFDEAVLAQADFGNVDLSEATGLDRVRHDAPSSIGFDTLRRSKGRIPEAFLRGCGLADWEIAFARMFAEGLTHRQIETIGYDLINTRNKTLLLFYSAFISYSHEDKLFAGKLHDALQAVGIRCWLDQHQLLPGDDIYEAINIGIDGWDKVLLCASKNSLTSWWVDNEISRAFAKEQQIMDERKTKVLSLIPLNLDGFLFDWQSAKAHQVKTRLAADFRGWDSDHAKFDAEFEKLIRAMRADRGGREQPPKPLL